MAGVRPYHARPLKRPSDLTHVRRQPGGARDPDAAGWQYRFRRLVATPRISRCQWHLGHRRRRFDRRIRHRHRQRVARAAAACASDTRQARRADRQCRHQQHRDFRGARALDFRTRRRRVAGRIAVLCAPDSAGSLPAFRSDRGELAHSGAAVQRAEPYGRRYAAGHRGAPVAPAANRRHQGGRGRAGARARAHCRHVPRTSRF